MSTLDPRDLPEEVTPAPWGNFEEGFEAPTHLPADGHTDGLYDDAPKLRRVRGRRPKDTPAEPRRTLRRAKGTAPEVPRLAVVGTPTKVLEPGVVAVVPSMTNFDFLEGSYNKVRQSRLVLELVAGAVGVIMILITALGLNAGIHANATMSSITNMKILVAADNHKYDTSTGLGTITGEQLTTDLSDRTAALKSALDSTTDLAAIVQQFRALAANGISITSIAISPTPPVTSATTTTVAGAAPVATTTTTAPLTATEPMSITVVAEVKNYDAYTTLATEVKNLHYVSNVSTVPSGGVPSITVTITAQVIGFPSQTPSVFIHAGGKL